MIPYARQYVDEDDINAVVEALKSDYLTTGPRIKQFEEAFATYVGAKYAVAVSNGTAALHAACFAIDIKEGDEVITTPITFAASANCVLYMGGTPVFADIDQKTGNISPTSIREKITAKTKAIIPVHYTGQPCDMDEIKKIAEEYNLIVIEDAAHALGATYKGASIGGISHMTTFSFHPVKHITTGEGGMITTNDAQLYQKLMQFRTHGITRDVTELINKDQPDFYYEQQSLGYNYRITDVQAALGLSQLNKIDLFIKRRKEIAKMYDEGFLNVAGIKTPFIATGYDSSWHLYVIQILNKSRNEVYHYLKQQGISVNVHHIPVYKHPYYKNMGCLPLENSENLYEKIISIPMYYGLKNEEVQYVIEKVKEALR